MYKLTSSTAIIRVDDGAFIPSDPLNSDYAAYLVWVAAGNTALPYQSLTDAQTTQIANNSAACQASIYAGFQSSALGAVYTYPFKETDQSNLADSVTASLYPNLAAGWTTPFWCEDVNGNWAFMQHTIAQIQQVGLDAKANKLSAITRNETMRQQILAATTIAQVQAIVW